MKYLAVILWFTTALLVTVTTTSAQSKSYTVSAETYFELPTPDLPAAKAETVSAELILTERETRAFFPLYKRYNEVIMALNKAKLALMRDYEANYESMTSDKARELLDRSLDLDEKRQLLRKKFYQEFTRVLNARAAADLIQLDRRLDLLIDLQIASVGRFNK